MTNTLLIVCEYLWWILIMIYWCVWVIFKMFDYVAFFTVISDNYFSFCLFIIHTSTVLWTFCAYIFLHNVFLYFVDNRKPNWVSIEVLQIDCYCMCPININIYVICRAGEIQKLKSYFTVKNNFIDLEFILWENLY